MKYLAALLLILLLSAGQCEFPEVEPTPPPAPEEPLVSNLYEELRHNYLTDLYYIKTTAVIRGGDVDSVRITYACSEEFVERVTTATYILSYEIQTQCKSATEITYTFYSETGDTTITNTYPQFVFESPTD